MHRDNTIQIVIAVIGLIGIVAGGVLSNWDKIFGPAPQVVQTQQVVQATQPAAANQTVGYQPVGFDGRVGLIEVRNTSLYEYRVTLWHPDDARIFGTWIMAPTSKQYLKIRDEAFAIGNDWGVQLGDSAVRPIGEAARWKGGTWTLSQESFHQ